VALAGALVLAAMLLAAGHSLALGPPPCDPSDTGCPSPGDGPTTVHVTLTVVKPSTGTVQDSPQSGINCGTDCTEGYTYTLDCSVDPCDDSDAQPVTLVATGGPPGDTSVWTVCDSNSTGSTCTNSRSCGTGQCTVDMNRSLKVSVAWLDQSPPTTPSFTSPPAKVGPNGATFTATASDNTGVTSMQFFLDNAFADSDSSAPYQLQVSAASLADGSTHTVKARAVDGSSNQSQLSNPVSFTVDKSTTTAIQSPAAGGSFKTPPQFSFSRPGDFASATCETLSGPSGSNVVASGSCNGGTYTPQSGPDGVYRMRVTVTDDVGNSASDERGYQIDSVAPDLQVTSPTNGSTVTSPFTPTYTASDSGSGSQVAVACKLETDSAYGACGPITAAPGPHALSVRATDLAGNETVQTVAFAVESPSLSVKRRVSISFKHGSFSGSVKPGGGCASAEKVRLYQVKPGPDRVVGRATTKPGGRWSIHVPAGRTGRFYAKVKPSSNGNDVCMPARSKIVRVS
jgi:hypothetical protein